MFRVFYKKFKALIAEYGDTDPKHQSVNGEIHGY